MSWDGYIDNLIGQSSGSADKVWIGGKDGNAWTTAGHENAATANANDVINMVKACDDIDATPLQAGGIHFNGIKFQFLRCQDKVLLGKKKDHGFVTAQTSKTAIVIATGKEGTQQANLNKAVAVIAEYLESLGM